MHKGGRWAVRMNERRGVCARGVGGGAPLLRARCDSEELLPLSNSQVVTKRDRGGKCEKIRKKLQKGNWEIKFSMPMRKYVLVFARSKAI